MVLTRKTAQTVKRTMWFVCFENDEIDVALVEMNATVELKEYVAIPVHRGFIGGLGETNVWRRPFDNFSYHCYRWPLVFFLDHFQDNITDLNFANVKKIINEECHRMVDGKQDAEEIQDSILCVYSGKIETGVCPGDWISLLVFHKMSWLVWRRGHFLCTRIFRRFCACPRGVIIATCGSWRRVSLYSVNEW